MDLFHLDPSQQTFFPKYSEASAVAKNEVYRISYRV